MLHTKKNKMLCGDKETFFYKCREVWRAYVSGSHVTVITDHKISPEDLFKEYFNVIVEGVQKGTVEIKTVSEITLQDLENNTVLVEF